MVIAGMALLAGLASVLGELTPDTVLNVSQLGVAGLMGALWWWERRYSRQREEELTQAHQKIMAQGQQLGELLTALQENTKAVATFTAVQQELVALLRDHAQARAA